MVTINSCTHSGSLTKQSFFLIIRRVAENPIPKTRAVSSNPSLIVFHSVRRDRQSTVCRLQRRVTRAMVTIKVLLFLCRSIVTKCAAFLQGRPVYISRRYAVKKLLAVKGNAFGNCGIRRRVLILRSKAGRLRNSVCHPLVILRRETEYEGETCSRCRCLLGVRGIANMQKRCAAFR